MIKRFFLVLMICLYICSCGGSSDSKNKNGGQEQPNGGTVGTNNDPAHPDGSGAGGIGTDVTKGDMKDAEPMEMTNDEYFAKALSAEVMKNVTVNMSNHYDDEIDNNLFMRESQMRMYSKMTYNNYVDVDEHWMKESLSEEKPYRICLMLNGAVKADWQNYESMAVCSNTNGVMISGFGLEIIDIVTLINDKSKFTYDADNKRYTHNFSSEDVFIGNSSFTGKVVDNGFTSISLAFAGNLVKTARIEVTEGNYLEAVFSYYGTTEIENWPVDE